MPITKTIPKELFALIDAQPLLKCLPQMARDQLITESTIKSFQPGESLIIEDSENSFLFLLLKGQASATMNGTRVGSLEAGDIAGEISISGISPPIADVIAEYEVDAIAFPATKIGRLIDGHPKFGQHLREAALRRISG